jgi:hypothetical protein
MRRWSGVVLASALVLIPAASPDHGRVFAQAAPAPQKTTFTGDTVVLVYAVNQGKEADYEKVLEALKGALQKSTAPEAKQQAAGWKVFKSEKPLTPDGLPAYVHVINPVVKDADYSIVNIVYSVSSDEEKRTFYDLYRGALKGPLSLIQGPAVSDLAK